MASSNEPDRHLRLLRGGRAPDEDAASRAICSYTNRLGVRYYLHVTETRHGQTQYVARRSVVAGALSAMPAGFEFSESLGGVVSVRRAREPSRVPMADFDFVTGAVNRHRHLRDHVVERCSNRLVIHEPDPELSGIDILCRELSAPDVRIYSRANKPRVRSAMAFTIVGEWATDGPKAYEARAPRNACDMQWDCLGQGRIEDLVARFVDDLEASPLTRKLE